MNPAVLLCLLMMVAVTPVALIYRVLDRAQNAPLLALVEPDEPEILEPEPEPLALDFRAPEAYSVPSSDLLVSGMAHAMDADATGVKVDDVLSKFKLDAKVVEAKAGSSVTRLAIELGDGVKVEKVAALAKNFAYALGVSSVRIQAPIPGRSAVGIEVANTDRRVVHLGDVLADAPTHPLSFAVGEDIDGDPVWANLADMPHLLVAGSTGSGKSSFINSLLLSMLTRATPADLRMVLVDPKMVELMPYSDIPHLLAPIVTETEEAVFALHSLVGEMERRYELMQRRRVRHIDAFNDLGGEHLPYVVAVVDELADLMMTSGRELESLIVRLAQKGRAAGVHLVLATQRPSVDVVTGLIKANVPSRLAFATASAVDSRVVLDVSGAEKLAGRGDALFSPVGASEPLRVQGAYVSDVEIEAVTQAASGEVVRL